MSLIPISINSYDAFRTDALNRAGQGLGYDVDGSYGYQCWDLAAELWMHLSEFEDGNLWPKTGPHLYAEECWTVSKDVNSGSSFTQITSMPSLQRGDVIVLGPSAISQTGHIAFCDEDYNGTNFMDLLGQNQVNPNPDTGHIPTVTNIDISAFLGAFRLNSWQPTPPTPSFTDNRRDRLMLILRTYRQQGGQVL